MGLLESYKEIEALKARTKMLEHLVNSIILGGCDSEDQSLEEYVAELRRGNINDPKQRHLRAAK